MNFGRNGVMRQMKRLKSRSRWIGNKIKAIVLIVVVLVIVGGVCTGYNKVTGWVNDIIADAPEFNVVDTVPTGYMSTVYDVYGNTTAELVASGANRIYVTLDEIPIDLQHAFVAIEDERFYEHNGIDIKGIVRAAATGLSSGSLSQGASTITQQLLKNNVFDNWTTETGMDRVKRKIQEQYLAIQLEKKVSKDWIMENYLNTINLGQNTLGVQTASMRYFGKDVSELNLSECAVIAAITQNPSKYNPISNPEDNNERRLKVLENMLDQGYITEAEYTEAVNDDVYSRINDVNSEYTSDTTNTVTSYFVDALTDQVLEDLQSELGYTESQAYNALYSGGLQIYSTQDPTIQAYCDDAVNDESLYGSTQVSFLYSLSLQEDDDTVDYFSESTMLVWLKANKNKSNLEYSDQESAQEAIDEYREYVLSVDGGTIINESVTFTLEPQTSMVVIDQSNGQVKALTGGRGDKSASKTLNRASGTTMQPGSTFKIITTYAPALDRGIVTLASALVDEKITYANGKVIKNSGGGYGGLTTIRDAIKRSVNVIAIKTSREVGLEECYQSALDFGITTLTEDDIVEALPLGGITDGVTNLEMTAAYAAIANGGVYNEPIYYTKITDIDGNVLIDRTAASHRVIQETTAWLLTSAMEDVVKSGTGTRCSFDGMSIAGKTGTTSSNRASWFIGYTPYYTCGIWGGYDDNSELSETNFTKYIWKEAMQNIHEGLDDPGFPEPDGIVKKTVCASSGLLPSSTCTSLRTEYFSADTVPTQVCSGHKVVKEEEEEEETSGEEPSENNEGSTGNVGGEEPAATPADTGSDEAGASGSGDTSEAPAEESE
ncbi:MAG: PBP1A family penicillin-binding protein [Clostridiales bacterium]|nr:PBP1A family penicillin-binding protein [Clostridiales bacterium]